MPELDSELISVGIGHFALLYYTLGAASVLQWDDRGFRNTKSEGELRFSGDGSPRGSVVDAWFSFGDRT